VTLILADLIEKAYRHDGVVIALIYGDMGCGKTSYALWTAYEVLGSWRKALDSLFFHPGDAMKAMERAIQKGRRLPIIILDDAGLWLERETWWEEHKIRFAELFNVIRSICAGVIFTSPSEELPKQIINKIQLRVKALPASEEDPQDLVENVRGMAAKFGLKPLVNKALGYRRVLLPSFFGFVRQEYRDYYPLQYPVYKEYCAKRDRAVKYFFEKWKASLGEEGLTRRERKAEGLEFVRQLLHEGKPRSEIIREARRRFQVSAMTVYRWLKELEKREVTA